MEQTKKIIIFLIFFIFLNCNDLDCLDTEPGTFNQRGADTTGKNTSSSSLKSYLENPNNSGEMFQSDPYSFLKNKNFTQPIEPDDEG